MGRYSRNSLNAIVTNSEHADIYVIQETHLGRPESLHLSLGAEISVCGDSFLLGTQTLAEKFSVQWNFLKVLHRQFSGFTRRYVLVFIPNLSPCFLVLAVISYMVWFAHTHPTEFLRWNRTGRPEIDC